MTSGTDPEGGRERVLEALIWSCGFSKRQAFIQAVDRWWRFRARFKLVVANVGALCICAFCKRKGARSVGVHVGVEEMYVLYRCMLKVQHGGGIRVCNFVRYVCVFSLDEGNFKRTGYRVSRWHPIHSNEN